MKTVLAVLASMLFAGMMAVAVPGCSDSDKQVEVEAIEAVLKNNLKALQEEDLDTYMATLDEESAGYETMKRLCPQIFAIYDLEHEIEEVRVLDISDQEARVRTVQTARRLAGPESYRHNRSTTVHTLKNRDGDWKIYETQQESMEYLD